MRAREPIRMHEERAPTRYGPIAQGGRICSTTVPESAPLTEGEACAFTAQRPALGRLW